MLKGLIATCLLTFSCSTPKHDVKQPQKVIYTESAYEEFDYTDSGLIQGAYNFKYHYMDEVTQLIYNLDARGNRDWWSGVTLCTFPTTGNNSSYSYDYSATITYIPRMSNNRVQYIVSYINCSLEGGATLDTWYLDFTIHYVDPNDGHEDYIVVSLEADYFDEDMFAPDLILNVNRSFYLDGDFYAVFNTLFTKEDNNYVRTYNGYYNFTANDYSNSLNTNWFDIYGNVLANYGVYSAVSTYEPLVSGQIACYKYFPDDNVFNRVNLNQDFYGFPNIYMNGSKMTNVSYQHLSNIGVFSYVRDTTYDNADFHDLLFSIMDSPVYFLSRLMSFELFGINLFIAFTGLLTFCVILVLIRKFW